MNGLWLYSLALLGAAIAEFVTGRPNGPLSSISNYPNQKWPSLFIGFGISKIERAYHIHHWMSGTMLVILLMPFTTFIEELWYVEAFLAGIILQGLTYGDRFMIRIKLEAN